MKIFLSFIVALGFWHATVCLGENAKPKDEKDKPVANAKTWAGLEVDALILDLQDDKRVLWLLFHSDGYASVTLGQKGGGLAGPVCPWKVSGEWMQIFRDEDETKLWFQIRLLKRTDKTITVENETGEKQVFEIERR